MRQPTISVESRYCTRGPLYRGPRRLPPLNDRSKNAEYSSASGELPWARRPARVRSIRPVSSADLHSRNLPRCRTSPVPYRPAQTLMPRQPRRGRSWPSRRHLPAAWHGAPAPPLACTASRAQPPPTGAASRRTAPDLHALAPPLTCTASPRTALTCTASPRTALTCTASRRTALHLHGQPTSPLAPPRFAAFPDWQLLRAICWQERPQPHTVVAAAPAWPPASRPEMSGPGIPAGTHRASDFRHVIAQLSRY
jgi:hypothetical protein